MFSKVPKRKGIRAVIISPTRDLAQQVGSIFNFKSVELKPKNRKASFNQRTLWISDYSNTTV